MHYFNIPILELKVLFRALTIIALLTALVGREFLC